MMTVIIRQAQNTDIVPLCQLVHAFHEFHVAGLPLRLASLGSLNSFDTGELGSKLLQIIEDTKAAVFVAERDGHLVGFAEVYFRQDEPNPAVVSHAFGYLQSLMVQAEARTQGIGKSLLVRAEKWAQIKGAEEMRLETWEFGQGPLKFYEKFGYKTLKRTLVREFS